MNNRSRVLVLAYYFPPQNTSGAMRPARFVKYLQELGHTVKVVALETQQGTGSLPNVHLVPRAAGGPVFAQSISLGAQVIERVLPYNDRLPWVSHAVAEAGALHRSSRFDVILSTSPPLATHVAALRLKRRLNVKWVADFRDPLYGNPFRTRKIGRIYDSLLERVIFRHADAVIANTDVVADAWRAKYPQWRDKICLIWNGFDPGESVTSEPAPPRARRILLHAGTLYGGRQPTLLLQSIQRLLARGALDPQTLLVDLVGPIEPDKLEPFQDLVKAGCLRYNGLTVSRDEAARRMSETDFLLLLDINEANAGVQVPAKLFDYIRVGRPVLAVTTANSPSQRILEGSAIPHVCLFPGEPAESTDSKISAFFHLPSTRSEPSPWFFREFDARAQAKTLSGVIGRVLGPKV